MTVESEFKLAIRHQMLHPFWMTSSAAALIRFVWIRYSSHLLGFNKPWEAATYVTTRRLLEGGCMANSYRAGWVQRSAGDARIRFRMPRSLPRGTHCGVFVQDAGAGVMTFCHEVQGRCWSKKLHSGVASRKARRPDTARPCKSGTNDYINMTSLNFTLSLYEVNITGINHQWEIWWRHVHFTVYSAFAQHLLSGKTSFKAVNYHATIFVVLLIVYRIIQNLYTNISLFAASLSLSEILGYTSYITCWNGTRKYNTAAPLTLTNLYVCDVSISLTVVLYLQVAWSWLNYSTLKKRSKLTLAAGFSMVVISIGVGWVSLGSGCTVVPEMSVEPCGSTPSSVLALTMVRWMTCWRHCCCLVLLGRAPELCFLLYSPVKES